MIFLAGATTNERGIEDVIRGQRGNLAMGGNRLEVTPERFAADELEAGDRTPPDAGESHVKHMRNFLQSIRSNTPPNCNEDLGVRAKGYAVDAAIQILRSHEITSALLHGGTSSIYAIGTPEDGGAWQIGWTSPAGETRSFELRDAAPLGVGSARQGLRRRRPRPRSRDGPAHRRASDGRARRRRDRACSLESDALSTALLVQGPSWVGELNRRFAQYSAVAV